MPGKDQTYHGLDVEQEMMDAMAQRLRESIDNSMNMAIDGRIFEEKLSYYENQTVPKIVLPQQERERKENEHHIDAIKKLMELEYEKQRRNPEPIERVRRELLDEIGDIKIAVRKLGILLDCEKPTAKQLEQHKMLREAYQKYKMIESLIFGKQSD
jgi:hypothetical protein